MTHAPHLALVGLPGAGKSTVAAALGARLGRAVVDFDVEIERREGRTISAIFEAEGEAYFRALEASLTTELRDAPASILSPGGGWVTRPETVAVIRARTRIVWLQVSPATALARMGGNRIARPLLMKGDPEAILTRLEADRRSAYAGADAVVNTEVIGLQELVDQVAQLATFWGSGVG